MENTQSDDQSASIEKVQINNYEANSVVKEESSKVNDLELYSQSKTIKEEKNILIDIEIDELPMIESSIKLPSLPQTIRYRSNSAVKITNIRYQLEKHNYDDQLTLKIFITGEMTLGSSNTAKTSLIGWRLIDDEGYIIDSGNWYTDDLTIGEKFRDKEFSIFNVNPGVYSLELRNVN